MLTLFAGGQEDGNWHDVPKGREYFHVIEKTGRISIYMTEETWLDTPETILVYKKRSLKAQIEGEGRTYRESVVMVLLEDGESFIQKLIDGYGVNKRKQVMSTGACYKCPEHRRRDYLGG